MAAIQATRATREVCRRPGCIMGRKYSGSAALSRRRRAGHGCRNLEASEELLREFEALRVAVRLHRDSQLERAFEAVIPVGMLHQSYDRARIDLVLFLEQRIAALGPEIE